MLCKRFEKPDERNRGSTWRLVQAIRQISYIYIYTWLGKQENSFVLMLNYYNFCWNRFLKATLLTGSIFALELVRMNT